MRCLWADLVHPNTFTWVQLRGSHGEEILETALLYLASSLSGCKSCTMGYPGARLSQALSCPITDILYSESRGDSLRGDALGLMAPAGRGLLFPGARATSCSGRGLRRSGLRASRGAGRRKDRRVRRRCSAWRFALPVRRRRSGNLRAGPGLWRRMGGRQS